MMALIWGKIALIQDWLVEQILDTPLATGIAFVALIVAIRSLSYQRSMAKNDAKRMKRKDPVFEIQIAESERLPGWRAIYVTVRNLEPVGVHVSSVHVRRCRRGLVTSYKDAHEPRDNLWEELVLRNNIAGAKEITLRLAVEPAGTEHIHFFAKDIRNTRALSFKWSWADGKRH